MHIAQVTGEEQLLEKKAGRFALKFGMVISAETEMVKTKGRQAFDGGPDDGIGTESLSFSFDHFWQKNETGMLTIICFLCILNMSDFMPKAIQTMIKIIYQSSLSIIN